jgi:hypothetical protein
MQITNLKMKRLAEDFKSFCVDLYHETYCKQEEIADALGTTQATIARWFSYNTELHFPAFAIPLLPDEMKKGVITYLAKTCGLMILPEIKIKEKLDGSIDDEMSAMVQKLGAMVDDFKNRPNAIARMEKRIYEMHEVIQRMKAEVEQKQEGK